MSNKLSLRAHWPRFLGLRMVRKGLGTTLFDQKKMSGPRGGLLFAPTPGVQVLGCAGFGVCFLWVEQIGQNT